MKKKVSLIELWKINKQTRTPLWGSTEFLSQFPFMNEYLTSFNRIDRDFIVQKGFLQPVWNTQYEDTDSEVLMQFKEDVENLILRNQNTYQRLYTLTKQEYNPIENYDRQEETHDINKDNNKRTSSYGEGTEHYNYGERTSSNSFGAQIQTSDYGAQSESMNYGAQSATNNFGAQTQTNDYGTQSESTNYGAQSATTNFGAQTQTNKYGAQTQTDVYGAQTQTTNHGGHSDSHVVGEQTTNTTHNIAGFNGGLEAESSDSVSAGSRTDNDTIGAYSDSTSTNEFTDSSTASEHTDTLTNAGHSDTSSTEAHIDSHTRNGFTDTLSNSEHTDISSKEAYVDSHTRSGFTDTQNTAAHTDTATENARSDVHTTDAKEDIHVDENNSQYNHTARIHGNIGVTTTAQMIEGERQLWMAFNFYKTIYDDIAKELCVYCDEGIDAFYAGFNDLEEEEMVVIGNDQIRASVEQTPDGAIITITDSTGTSSAKISNGTDGTNGKDGITPKFKVEEDGDLYVDYSGQ